MPENVKSKRQSDHWINPPDPAEKPEGGYEDHVREAIKEGRAQIEAGQGIPAEQVWKELGIE